jgi:uncharacterized protein YbbC (DUF1343 family)
MRAHDLAVLMTVTWALAIGAPARAPAQVRPGIAVLLADSARLVAGKRVGLLTNQTGVDQAGRRDVDLLRAAPGVRLMRLFSPEHGFRGFADQAAVADGVDSATGLPIYSLYGAAHPPHLDSLDLVVVDLQDIGARYYTYVGTAVLLMEAAARRGLPVVVLDRPNPLGGEAVQGNVRERAARAETLIGFLPIPMRHGMTLGELLRLANDTLHIHARLTVVPAAGWRRAMEFAQTGLPWVPPSPSMPSLESALHYPGTCLFEGTNLSVGRGTSLPFQVIGAPWLDTAALLRRLGEEGRGKREGLTGVELVADTVTPQAPSDGKFAGVRINVIRLRVTDRRSYDPTRAAVALLAALVAVQRVRFAFVPAHFDRLAGGPGLRSALLAGRAPAAIWRGWAGPLARFRRARGRYLIY